MTNDIYQILLSSYASRIQGAFSVKHRSSLVVCLSRSSSSSSNWAASQQNSSDTSVDREPAASVRFDHTVRMFVRAYVWMWLHAVVAAQDVHSVRDLPVHPGPVSVLPAGAAALAELHPAQPQLQRLLRQGERLDSLLLTPTIRCL